MLNFLARIVLSQKVPIFFILSLKEKPEQARDALSKPSKFRVSPENAFLMVAVEFKLTPANMKVLARRPDKSKSPVKQAEKFEFEGEDPIEFEDEDEVLHFFLPVDYAYVEDDSSRQRRAGDASI